MTAPENDEVVVVEYDHARKAIFDEEQRILEPLFAGTGAAIVHVGSTSIPGLGGKPVVDIMIGVSSLDDVENRLDWLEEYDYTYVPEYENSISERRFFRKPATGTRKVHLHCIPLSSDFFREHIEFRDYLRDHPETAADYYRLKQELANELGHDRDRYTEAKTEFVHSVLQRVKEES